MDLKADQYLELIEQAKNEVQIPVIAPVSQEMIKNFIAEKVLELPKSY